MNHSFNITFHDLNIAINADNEHLLSPAVPILSAFENTDMPASHDLTVNTISQEAFYRTRGVAAPNAQRQQIDTIRKLLADKPVYLLNIRLNDAPQHIIEMIEKVRLK